jgi:carotenoid 1,2-hydratase
MTEKGAEAITQHRDALHFGASAMRWDDDKLVIEIEERDIRLGIPWRRRVAGKVILTPEMINTQSFKLDPEGHHH